ncbi:unnamed protein product [Pedinophyceae sp. YPF-701]|nr:unnamed protein product [Pedinophyceae sp. YPF-701]
MAPKKRAGPAGGARERTDEERERLAQLRAIILESDSDDVEIVEERAARPGPSGSSGVKRRRDDGGSDPRADDDAQDAHNGAEEGGAEPAEAAQAGKKRTKRKDPNAPKRARSAYVIFSAERRPSVKQAHPDWKLPEVSRELARLWKECAGDDRKPYEEQAAKDRERYEAEMKAYKAARGEALSDDEQADRPQGGGRKGKGKSRLQPHVLAALLEFVATNPQLKMGKATDAFAGTEIAQGSTKAAIKAAIKESAEHVFGRWVIREAAVVAAETSSEHLTSLEGANTTVLSEAALDQLLEDKKNGVRPQTEEDGDPYELESDEDPADFFFPERELKEVEPPQEILMPLLPYQKEFLWWAMTQEKGPFQGGLLCDEMGMGKTIQAVSVIVSHRTDDQYADFAPEPLPPLKEAKPEIQYDSKGKPKKPKMSHWEVEHPRLIEDGCDGQQPCRATLVLCPVVAVIQWRQEIARFVKPGTLKVVTYHGPKRGGVTAKDLQEADVVLATYSTLENDYRRFMMPLKVECPYCSKKYYPDRLKVHLKFFCGPGAHKSDALAKQEKKTQKIWIMKNKALKEDREKEKSKSAPRAKKQDRAKKSRVTKVKKEEDDWDADEAGPSDPSKARSRSRPITPARTGGHSDDEAGGGGSDDPDFEADDVEHDEAEEDAEFEGGEDDGAVESGSEGSEENPEEYDPEQDVKVAELLKESETSRGTSILHKILWRRIILDEAHSIKDRRTNTAQAVFALNAKYRWALSGTPLQNRVNELYSQIRFLRPLPFAYYYCKQCPCKCLDYPFRKDWKQCEHCGHSPMQHFCWWNRMVANPIIYHGYRGRGRAALLRLRHDILNSLLLRRTKVQCADDLALPPRVVTLRKERLDPSEQDFYEALYTQSTAEFDSYVAAGTLVNNFAHIFDLLIRLRQSVCHPYLVIHSASRALAAPAGDDTTLTGTPATSSGTPGAADSAAEEAGMCSICHDPIEDPVTAECGHSFCRLCVGEYLESLDDRALCPKDTCGKPLTVNLGIGADASPGKQPAPPPVLSKRKQKSIINRIDKSNFRSSTKIEALREEIDLMLQKDPSAKCIVFSQFTSILDIIEFRLQQCGVKTVKLQGSMSLEQRDAVIDKFTNDPSVVVFLMSLKAGGVALNLTAASHVMLMDPWWNPAVEQQAQDRIHRLGQYKPISVTRFIIAGTIEERILKLQEKKQLMFESTVGQDHSALGKLGEEDLKFLFGRG